MGSGQEERIGRLESTVAFQDRTIEQLSQVVAGQDARVARLEAQLRQVLERLGAGSSPVRSIEDEEPPPHY